MWAGFSTSKTNDKRTGRFNWKKAEEARKLLDESADG